MRVLITRPQGDAEVSAERLRAAGHEVILAPLLNIMPLSGPELDLRAVAAVLLTSANGARALAKRTAARDVAVFAVGDVTARTARDLGFMNIASAGGDVADLIALVRRALPPCRLIHVAASVSAGDLAGELGKAGFSVERVVAYEARPVAVLPAAAAHVLGAGEVDVALFYSPRTGRVFVDLVRQAGLERKLAKVTAAALSDAVAATLQSLSWRRIVIAKEPTEAALLSAIGLNVGETT